MDAPLFLRGRIFHTPIFMKHLLPLLLLVLLACKPSNDTSLETHKYTNDLVHETSPYLLQHAHNPVHWKPWGEAALREAKETNKLMIISIGYAACHWCHVMEKESFEDSTVAAVMNEHFISIKVDREERPDVDQTYINAVQLMTGSAGWPLNAITLPDGRPIFGGTYFRKEQWIRALEQVQELYENSPEKLEEYASKLEEGIKSMDLVTLNTSEINFKEYDYTPMIKRWKNQFDTIDGGGRGAPKFMMPNQWETLLRWGFNTKDSSLTNQVYLSLKKMAYGGLYDHVGGGFARYSTDDRWHIPHFEKMLYDNAQLVSLYSKAYRLHPEPLYQEVVEETLDFVAREFTHEEGVFYSSLDADSDNASGELEEGAFYTFSLEELQELISDDWTVFADYFNINAYGLWKEENKYVLTRTKAPQDLAKTYGLSLEVLQKKVKDWKQTLFAYRAKRSRPRLDDKSLTSWNALMIQGYVEAYKSFGNPEYLRIAIRNANFILEKQRRDDGSLFHSYKNGKSTINGYLEDYASSIQAFLSLYEVTFDKKWLYSADKLAQYTLEKFLDSDSQMFYFTSSEDKEIISRKIDYRDNVIPATNSIMAKNLFVLSHHMYNTAYGDLASQMLKNVQPELDRYPGSLSNWIDLLANYRFPFYEVVVVGSDAEDTMQELLGLYLPNELFAGSTEAEDLPLLESRYVEGKTFIYVCVNNSCKLPVESVSNALKLLE